MLMANQWSHHPGRRQLRAAPGDSSNPKQRPRRPGRHSPVTPRPLHTQRLAGWLASTAAGLGIRTGHHVVGQLCNALHASQLDLEAWTGPQLVAALNADMKQRGLTWPDQITSPGPFLAQRLRHLPARPPASTGVGSGATAVTATAPPQVSAPQCELSRARLEAQRRIRDILARRSHRPDHTPN